jgi:flagellar basal-body rod protein FlgC
MSLFQVFDIVGGAMSAQSARLNTTASNLANAETVSGKAESVYQEKQPVFEAILLDNSAMGSVADKSYGVRVREVVDIPKEGIAKYEPAHPLADEKGYVYLPNINMIEQMANMMSASRSYQNTVEVLDTTTQLALRTLEIGR